MDRVTPIPELGDARPIMERLRNNGFKTYMAGGAVRDMLLGLCPKDIDILTNALPEQILSVFAGEKVKRVGKSFPVCMVNGVEVATARSGSRPDPAFPETDLGMRDLTINAMAFNPETNTLMDPFNGKEDLEKGVVRFTRSPDDRIMEDPVRMVRACRFAARLNGRIDGPSQEAIKAHAGLIESDVAWERTRVELIKAMDMANPSLFFELLHETGLLPKILPCLARCVGVDGGPYHGETVFEHCLLVGDALPARQPLLRLAGFLHDVGKVDAAGIKEGRITFHGHEKETEALEADLERLRFSGKEKSYILALVKAHMRPLGEQTTPKSVRRLLVMLDELGLGWPDFMRIRIADKRGNLAKSPYTISDIRLRVKKIKDEITTRTAFNVNDLAVTGQDIIDILDIGTGPEVGRVKGVLFEKVLETPALNNRKSLMEMLAKLKEESLK